MLREWFSYRLTYGAKLFLLATLPLIVAASAISWVVLSQSRQLAETEIRALERELIKAKRDELKNYISIARTAFVNIYGRAAPDDDQAKLLVTQILAGMLYGQDGYFFVFDYEGTNLVAPRQTDLIDRNWRGLTDTAGVPITDELIRIARAGGGYHAFDWQKPSTREPGRMVAYVIGLQDWQWVVGTGVFIDDVLATVTAARSDMETRIARTFAAIIGITLAALVVVFLTGMFITIRERRLADAKLKRLTQRVFDAQEEERGRVARELHDGISQILVGIRYALDNARRRLARGEVAGAAEPLEKGMTHLSEAISEVRRISRDLRPGALDDLGLGPALRVLAEEFQDRTGIETRFTTVVFRGRMDQEARIALYRIAQEALTNVERHAGATCVEMDLRGHRRGATLSIRDNGSGLDARRDQQITGLGLRNMQERMEQLDGHLDIRPGPDGRGTSIDAMIPLSHMLPPDKPQPSDLKAAE